MTQDNLKPCPFCACLASMQCHGSIFEGESGYRVECEGKCHAMTCYWHTEAEAREHWNTRAVPREPTEAMIEAGRQAFSDWDEIYGITRSEFMWRAMYDAFLKDRANGRA